jgi:hypothetical protein
VRCLSLQARLLLALAGLFCVGSAATADVFRPAYLELRELDADRYDVLLKVPAQGTDLRLSLDVRFPPGTVDVEPRRSQFVTDTHIERWRITRPGGLVGEEIEIVGRAVGVTDVLARI